MKISRVSSSRLAAAMALFITSSVFAQSYQLVSNFTAKLPSSASIVADTTSDDAKVGVASARLAYTLDPQKKIAELALPEQAFMLDGAGVLRVWVKGDGSGNELSLFVRHADVQADAATGTRKYGQPSRLDLPRRKLDFTDWREVEFDARIVPPGRAIWWGGVTLTGKTGDALVSESVIRIDDLRLFGGGAVKALTASAVLLGPDVREYSTDIAVALDVRSFESRPVKVQTRLTLTDRNQNVVADRDFTLDVSPRGVAETRLELKPDNLASFVPPFRLSGDVLSPDVPALGVKIDRTIVMGNSLLLWADMGMFFSHWFTAADPSRNGRGTSEHAWIEWTQGEGQRTNAGTQTTTRISRVPVTDDDAKAAATQPSSMPMGRHAMRIDYNGEAFVYRGIDRYLPGFAYSVGVWVKGNGSKSELFAHFLDYTDLADFYPGGWKRITNGRRKVCSLDFTGWRYFRVDLPGNGIGVQSQKGSTDGLDMPLELTAFRVTPAKGEESGSVEIGSVYVHTQQSASESLTAHVDYDNADLRYAANHGAWLLVQNAARIGSRKIESLWELSDREGKPIASGRAVETVEAGKTWSQRVEPAQLGSAGADAQGPLRLKLTATDLGDPSASITRAIALSKPDSRLLHADFEAPRTFLALKAEGVPTPPPENLPSQATSDAQAHTGKRSLELAWDKTKRKTSFTSVDPALPGQPVEISMWVNGDESGVLFYPLIGDRKGVPAGLWSRQWDILLTRTVDGALQNAVRVDWKGWKQLRFIVPLVPATWDQYTPNLGYVPSYPLGVHLAVDASDATVKPESGSLFVDDIEVFTHLAPEARVTLDTVREGDSNILMPGGKARLAIANGDTASPRKVKLAGGVLDWRGKIVAASPAEIMLAPGERKEITLDPALKPGAYLMKLRIEGGDQSAGALDQDLIVLDPTPIMGSDWREKLIDEWKLRSPVMERYTYIDEDWDWVEHHPGNFQADTIRLRSRRVTDNGCDPWVLLGFSAYWSSGAGYERMKSGSFQRVNRHVGQGVDVFLIPQRMEDWSNYMEEVMRSVGGSVAGFVLWDNPDGASTIAMPPERFAKFLTVADKWRRAYAAKTPMIIGGMNRATVLPYIEGLKKAGAIEAVSGVNVRFDVGRLSPEDAETAPFARELVKSLRDKSAGEKVVVFTDLDWAVEKDPSGLNVFDQAANLSRSDLLLRSANIRPVVGIRNEDSERLGTGLVHRRVIAAPPMTEKVATCDLKPAWLALSRTRQLLDACDVVFESELSDSVPRQTRVMALRRKADGKSLVVVWRNGPSGWVGVGESGLVIESAEDVLGSTVSAESGWYAIGPMPIVLQVSGPADDFADRVRSMHVRDEAEPTWPQRTLASFQVSTGKRFDYVATGSQPARLSGATLEGDPVEAPGLVFDAGGTESFRVKPRQGSGLVLRKIFVLDKTGFDAEVVVNGKPVGTWNLRHSEPELNEGVRAAEYFVDAASLGGAAEAQVTIKYAAKANSIAWSVLELRGVKSPITSLGPIHANQSVGRPRTARNMVGGPIKVGQTSFAGGLGVFANSLVEYPINGAFKRFRAKVGVDTATDGRGSVVFEVWGDGKRLWASKLLSGLDAPADVDVDIANVNRLRLIVTDGGDGNRFDAANWCDATLER